MSSRQTADESRPWREQFADGRHVDVWLLRQPALGNGGGPPLDRSVLNTAERDRARACKRSVGGEFYAMAHIALRRLLGAYLGTSASAIDFVREPCPNCGRPNGKPVLSSTTPSLHFSLAHGSGMIVVGVAGTSIGVDVEPVPGAETVRVCAPAMHPAEQVELETGSESARAASFGQLWTRKEAYLKGLGTGMCRDLAADYVGSDPKRHPAGWMIRDISCGPEHVAAVAVLAEAPLSIAVRWLPLDWLRTEDAHSFGWLVAPSWR